MVVVEVRQGTLGVDGRGWGPTENTVIEGRGWAGGESNNPHLAGGEKELKPPTTGNVGFDTGLFGVKARYTIRVGFWNPTSLAKNKHHI